MTKNSFLLLAVAIPLLTMGAGCATQSTYTQTSPAIDATSSLQAMTGGWGTYSMTQYGFEIQTPLGFGAIARDIDGGETVSFSTSHGKIVIEVVNKDRYSKLHKNTPTCYDNPSGAEPSHKTINGIDFVVFDFDRLMSGEVSTSAKEYCAERNGFIYKLIPQIPYASGPYVDVNKDSELNHMLSTFKVTKTASSLTPWATKACGAGIFGRLTKQQQSTLSSQFQGVTISDIAKNYLALSGSQAIAITAVVSTDGHQLVVAYASCDGATGQDVNGTTPNKMFSLDGTVVHLVAFTGSDATTGHLLVSLPVFSGSNFAAMFLPVGFISATSRVLVKGEIYGLGAGGSCATTYWMTVNASTGATTSFSTDPTLMVYGDNSHIVYLSPNPCMDPPQSIHVMTVTTGADQMLKTLTGNNAYAALQSVEVIGASGGPNYVLHYTTHDPAYTKNTTSTLVLP